MSINVKIVPLKNSLSTPPEVKYYPCAVSSGTVALEELAQEISHRCTLTEADCYASIIALSEVIADALSNGKIIKMDKLGSLQLTLKSKGSSTPEACSKTNIIGNKIVFKPSKYLKKRMETNVYKLKR